MKAKKQIKAPNAFTKSSSYIAAVLFALCAFLYALGSIVELFAVKNHVFTPDYVRTVSYIIVFIVAAMFSAFKLVKLMPIPFALIAGIELFLLIRTTFLNLLHGNIVLAWSFIGELVYSLGQITLVFACILMIALMIFSLIKKTRKVTVVWFIPSIFFGFASLSIVLGYVIYFIFFLQFFLQWVLVTWPILICAIILTVASIFVGLSVRAYAKQKMYDAQLAEAEKDEIIQ